MHPIFRLLPPNKMYFYFYQTSSVDINIVFPIQLFEFSNIYSFYKWINGQARPELGILSFFPLSNNIFSGFKSL